MSADSADANVQEPNSADEFNEKQIVEIVEFVRNRLQKDLNNKLREYQNFNSDQVLKY